MSTSRFVHVVEDAVPDRRALIAHSPSMQQLLQRLPRLAEAGGAVLLRALDDGLRVVAATRHDLAAETEAKRLRADLGKRLLAVAVEHRPVDSTDLPPHFFMSRASPTSRSGVPQLDEVERRHILAVYEHTGRNKRRASDLLGISLRTLYNKLREYRVHGATAPAAPPPPVNGAGALSR